MRKQPWYPLLIALHPALVLLAENADAFAITALLRPGLVLLASGLAATLLLGLLLGDRDKGALVASALLVLLFSQRAIAAIGADRGMVLTSIVAALLLVGVIPLRRLRVDLKRTRAPLNWAALLVVAIPCSQLAYRECESVFRAHSMAAPASLGATGVADLSGEAGREKPNIFYILLDGYSRNDMLLELYGFDNGEFVAGLEQRGFFVARNSRTNYAFTHQSLPCLLKMDYLAEGESLAVPNRRSRVHELLGAMGYRFVAIGTGYSAIDYESADVFIPQPHGLSEFEKALVASAGWQSKRFLDFDRNRVLFSFDQLPKLAQTPRGMFVLAHVIAPHPPYLFDRNGEAAWVPGDQPITMTAQSISREGMTREESSKAYLEQVRFINREVLRVIDQIDANSAQPAIIVVQSDHGHHDYFDMYHAPERSYLKDRYSNMAAFRLVHSNARDCIGDDITLVNTFRRIFACELHSDLRALPDRFFLSRPPNYSPIQEVTGMIGDSADEARKDVLSTRKYFDE